MKRINNLDTLTIAINAAAERSFRSTCQLYQWEDARQEWFVANGCVILFKHDASFYCFSCAHVLADMQLGTTFFVMQDKMMFTLGGNLFNSEPMLSEVRADDSLDFAVARLNEPLVKELLANGHEFIDISRVRTIDKLVATDLLLVAAYPASKTKIDRGTMAVKVEPLVLLTGPDLGSVREKAYAGGFHHLVKYRIRSLLDTSTKERVRGPQPHGISGSGLWLFARDGQALPAPELIGILSEYHENRGVFISTKIDIFLEIVRLRFDSSIKHEGISLEVEDPDNPPSQ